MRIGFFVESKTPAVLGLVKELEAAGHRVVHRNPRPFGPGQVEKDLDAVIVEDTERRYNEELSEAYKATGKKVIVLDEFDPEDVGEIIEALGYDGAKFLEARLADLGKRNEELAQELGDVKNENAGLKGENLTLKNRIAELEKRLATPPAAPAEVKTPAAPAAPAAKADAPAAPAEAGKK